MNLLEELLEAWRYTRAGVIAEVENLPADRLLDVPDKLQRSPLDLVNHIVEAGWLMAGELSNPTGDFMRKDHGELTAEHTPPGDQFNGVPASRMSWMQHGISHEEYHRGQLALYARLFDETPALTKLIYGES